MKRFKIIAPLLAIMLITILAIVLWRKPAMAPAPTNNETTNQTPEDTSTEQVFDKELYSLTEPGSLWLIVNKSRPLPQDYKPGDLVAPEVLLNSQKTSEENSLRREPAAALKSLFDEAKTAGFNLMLASGFRSYSLQSTYYNSYVARDGQAAADRYSAKPGTSEHQTGLSLDISRADRKCYLEECFGEQPEGKWLAENVYRHGFILRYPSGQESVTGYQYEPWHFRYVGKELAAEISKSKVPLEVFFEL